MTPRQIMTAIIEYMNNTYPVTVSATIEEREFSSYVTFTVRGAYYGCSFTMMKQAIAQLIWDAQMRTNTLVRYKVIE